MSSNIDAAQYKHLVLGLIFLKYIENAFIELYNQLAIGEFAGVDPDHADE